MIILEEKTSQGILQKLIFRSEEPIEQFKAAIKVWLRDNYPQMGWEEFFNKLTLLDSDRVILNMA